MPTILIDSSVDSKGSIEPISPNPCLKRVVLPSERGIHEFSPVESNSENHRSKLAIERGDSEKPFPSLQERNRIFSQRPNTLTHFQNADLLKRGLTQLEIDGCLDRGWLWAEWNGYGIAAIDPQTDLIVGAQLAKDDRNPKYSWLLKGRTHLPETDQNPLSVWISPDFDYSKDCKVFTSEGFLKSLVAANKTWRCDPQVIFVGTAGNSFGDRALLRVLNALGDCDAVTLCPDAGANPGTIKQYLKALKVAQSWGFGTSIAWWNQTTKKQKGEKTTDPTKLDIDEIDPETFQSARLLTVPEFEAIAETLLPVPQNWLQRITKALTTHSTPVASAVALRRDLGEVDEQIFEYNEGDRLKTWQQASQQGYKRILDLTATGEGKSYDAGALVPADFQADRALYISNDRRNSTVPTLEPWREVEARHDGLTNQSGKLRRIKPGQTPTVAANCGRTEAISVLRNKGIQGADGDVVCQTCPLLNACKHFTGEGYGFKYQRRQALMGDRLKINPASLPDPADDFSYAQTVGIWDEAGTSIQTSRAISVSLRDLDQLISYLACQIAQQFAHLQPILSGLRLLLTGDQPRYGFTYREVVKALPTLDFSALDWDSLIQALQPNLSGLQPPDGIYLEDFSKESQQQIEVLKFKLKQDLAELKQQEELESAAVLSAQGVSILNKSSIRNRYQSQQEALRSRYRSEVADINIQVRSELKSIRRSLSRNTAQSQSEQTEILNQTVLKQWFPEFLGVLRGELGDLRINRGELILTLPESRHKAVIAASKLNIFLDATSTREDLALKLGCRPDEIFVCRQRVPKLKNLTITQVTDLGKLTLQRGDDKQRRATAIAAHFKQLDPTTKVIDFKKFETDRVWYRDSRGVNDFLTVKTLILVGTPIPNIAALLAEYSILTERHPTEDDPDFQAFVDRTAKAEIYQAIGRLRASRRLDEQLQIVILSDFDLGISTNKVKASKITLEAADKLERLQLAFKAAANQLEAEGKKITQTAVANLTSYSQQYLSRFWKLLLSLLETPNRESSKNSDPPPPLIKSLAEGIDTAINQFCETPAQVLEAVNEAFFELIELGQQAQFWQTLKAQTQIRILEVLALTLPPDQIRELGAIS